MDIIKEKSPYMSSQPSYVITCGNSCIVKQSLCIRLKIRILFAFFILHTVYFHWAFETF